MIRLALTDEIEPLAFDIRKVIARRAAFELRPGTIVNLGFGIADGVANISAEENLFEQITFTLEQGIVGVPLLMPLTSSISITAEGWT